MNDYLVIIPTYNEIENVREMAAAIHRHAPWADILFVDDNSPDGTGQLLDRMAAEDPRIRVLHREKKQGLGRAYIAGFKWALERHYEFIGEMDCDFSHNPADLPKFREAAQQADLVLGTRYKGGIRVINWPLGRLILSKCAAYYVQIISGMPFTDPTGGFKCFRRAVLETVNLDQIKSNGYSFQIEMTHHAWMQGFRIVEVPIVFEERRSGASKMSSAIVREALWLVWKLLFRSKFRRSPPREYHPRSVASRAVPA
ncbi:MAG: polyprenol monophosphomannose synthase [Kiritimatiellae bacterium]|nr:polyprenol monophosphomannose synthase [Kiritimatiellia bacterium]MDW8458169.1 polyprenol monophosphomannose synthase [Verrucomicrobiota bacterium]